MRSKTHIALAVAVPIALSVFPPSSESWAGLVIGALLPDIDTRGAIARPGSTFFSKLLPHPLISAMDYVGLLAARWIQRFLGHRGVLHYPLWGWLLVWAGITLSLPWLQWLGWGYLLHIVGDALTFSGAPLFGPIYQRSIRFTTLKTGSPAETTLSLILWGFIILHCTSLLIVPLFIGQ